MKKRYVAPKLEVEIYEINTTVASCDHQVAIGPEMPGHDICPGWDVFGDEPESDIASYSAQTSFYNDGTCSCYYSASGQGYFTS